MIYRVSGLGNLINGIKKEGFKSSSFKPRGINSLIEKAIAVLIIGVSILPVWVGGYFLAGTLVANQLGYISQSIRISGTGSMYPTFPKGEGKDPKELAKQIIATSGMLPYPNGLVLFGKRVIGHQLGRGDIVLVEDDKTREITEKMYGNPSGWIKRIIGIGGDNIELKNGIVYLNDKPLPEPYTAKPHSTFGETFLKECQKVIVPENSIFVMGDNRKGSGDSREVGFFNYTDVHYVLPLKNQKGDLVKNWRDTSKDFEETSKIGLNKEKYLELLNEKRKEAGVKSLTYQSKLETSASKRAEIMLKYDDLSFEATRSGYTMLKAMNDSGYSNIVYGEAPTFGYYEAGELLEYRFEFPDSKKFLLNKDYQEIGIAEVQGSLNGCPAQIIVQHFAGYVPPNYKQTDIDSWQTSLNQLRDILPSWENEKNYIKFYEANRADLDRMVDIIKMRITRIESIINQMRANKWLTKEQQAWIDQEKALYEEQATLAKKLNGWKP